MTQSIDNSEWVMQGVVRDPITGALLRVNADGSINVSGGGGGGGTGFTSATTAGTAIVATNNSNGLSMGVPAFITTARGSTDALGLNTAGTNITWTANSSGVSINAGGYAGTGFTSTTTAGTAVVGTHNTAGLSMGFPTFITNALTTARASTDAVGLNTAQSNVTWTVNSSGISLDGRGYAGTATTMAAGLTATLNSVGLNLSIGAYLTTARASTDAIGLNTANTNVTWTVNSSGLSFNASGYAGTATAMTSATATLNSAGLSLSIGPYITTAALSSAVATISSYQNMIGVQLAGGPGFGANGSSMAVAFNMPAYISASFLRVPVIFTIASTTLATTAASLNASVGVFSTINAAIYSQMSGANSSLLSMAASGSAGYTGSISISAPAAGNSCTITHLYSYQVTGGPGSSTSTVVNITQTNYPISTTIFSNHTGVRFIDIPFATSLTPGPYWLLYGGVSSSATNSTGASGASSALPLYNANLGASMINSYVGAMGFTNTQSGAQLGVGFFSTVGSVTTSNLPLSAITSLTSQAVAFFQLIRSV